MSHLHILAKGKHQFRFHSNGDRAIVYTSTGGQRHVTRDEAAAMWAHLCDTHGFTQVPVKTRA